MNAPDFNALYRADADPFEVASSWYERRKLAIALAMLPRERYRLAWDAAAGTGELALALAERCERVVASDASEVAVARMRERGIDARASSLPDVPGEARGAELIVLAEVLYYLDASALAATLEAAGRALAPGGELLSVHWLGEGEDLEASGPAITAALDARFGEAGWARLAALDDEAFAARIWRKP